MVHSMRISFNEIEMAVEKALYGSGYKIAYARSAARAAPILSALGFNAMDTILSLMDKSPSKLHTTVVDESAKKITIDCNHISCSLGGEVWALSLLENWSNGFETELVNVRDVPFLIPYLQKNAPDNMCLKWICQGMQRTARFCAGQSYFDLFESSVKGHSVLFEFEQDDNKSLLLSNADFSERYHAALANGIEIERGKWLSLCRFSKRMLVPESENSMKDAGESSDLVDIEDLLI